MGKIRRLRQKYHASVAKSTEETGSDNVVSPEVSPRLVPVVNKTSADKDNSSDNIFAGLKINLGEAPNLPSATAVDTSDTMSVASSFQTQKTGTKKERRKQRHEDFMKKIDTIRLRERAEKEREKREKTAVVGDMHPILNALPSLEELMASANKQESKIKTKKPGGIKPKKEAKKDFMSDLQMFMAVNKDPVYKSDPFGAVTKAIENRILGENEEA